MHLKTAQEIALTHTEEYEAACALVMRNIARASMAGCRDTVFDPRPESQYRAVKEKFMSLGYTFRPTGVVGGVRQDSEQICW